MVIWLICVFFHFYCQVTECPTSCGLVISESGRSWLRNRQLDFRDVADLKFIFSQMHTVTACISATYEVWFSAVSSCRVVILWMVSVRCWCSAVSSSVQYDDWSSETWPRAGVVLPVVCWRQRCRLRRRRDRGDYQGWHLAKPTPILPRTFSSF